MQNAAVEPLPGIAAPHVVNVFWESFYDYPVFRFLLQDSGEQYAQHLSKLIGLFVMARVLRHEPMFGVFDSQGSLVAATTTSIPDDAEPSPEFAAARDATWAELGPRAFARYQRCVDAWKPLGVKVPQLHVNMIGVCKSYQRTGLAGRLLRHVQELSRLSPPSEGVTLTTEDPRNVPFYQYLGYQVVGEGSISDEIKTWGFFRPNDSAGQ